MKHIRIFKILPFVLIFFVVAALLISTAFARQHIAGSVLRLHVIADSDNTTDQLLKLQVRDRILSDFGEKFRACQTVKEAEALAENYRESICAAARDELSHYDCDSSVEVSVAPCKFPTKSYGGIQLPAGVYTALQIRIGASEGHNWWCVLYPPLCLNKGSVSADSETLSKLRDSLTASEYDAVCGEDKVSVHFKFKLLEILGNYF